MFVVATKIRIKSDKHKHNAQHLRENRIDNPLKQVAQHNIKCTLDAMYNKFFTKTDSALAAY